MFYVVQPPPAAPTNKLSRKFRLIEASARDLRRGNTGFVEALRREPGYNARFKGSRAVVCVILGRSIWLV